MKKVAIHSIDGKCRICCVTLERLLYILKHPKVTGFDILSVGE